jgi:group I intron endonuclease
MCELKKCTTCGEEKEYKYFWKRVSAKDGYRNQCIKCLNLKIDRRKICGIYKITSPSGKIYIGQSKSIRDRWSSYRTRGCEAQPILQKSFNKYTVQNHTFEIIHYCDEQELDYIERYYQDLYEVIGRHGLNCVLVNKDNTYEKRVHNLVKNKKRLVPSHIIDILDVETGVFYYTVLDASKYIGVKRNFLADMLKGAARNKTSLIRGEDYEKGFLPHTLFVPQEYKRSRSYLDGFGVVDYKFKRIIGSTKEVAEMLEIKETTLRSYLKGFANNPTNFIYEKDFIKGVKPNELCESMLLNIKSINFITKKVFNTQKEVCEFYKISPRYAKKCLENIEESPLPIILISQYEEDKVYKYSPEKWEAYKKRFNRK